MTVYAVTTLDAAANTLEVFGSTRAQGINNAGQIVGSYSRTTVDPLSFSNHGFLYNRQAPSTMGWGSPASAAAPSRRASMMWAKSSGIT